MRDAISPSEVLPTISSQQINPQTESAIPQPQEQPQSPEDIGEFKQRLRDQIAKQNQPTSKEQYEFELWQRQNNPEMMPAEKLKEYQSKGWFEGYEPRELTPEQSKAEEAELDSLFNAAYPKPPEVEQPLTPQRLEEIIDDALSPENSLFKRKEREKFPQGRGVQINPDAEKLIRKDQGYLNDHPYMRKEDF